MRKFIIYSNIVISCTVLLTSCQSANTEKFVKTVTPNPAFVDENIETIDESAVVGVDRGATIVGKTARMPVRFWDKMSKVFRGVSDQDPYGRSAPYSKQEFEQDMLVDEQEGVIKPAYVRGEQYAKAYRSPFMIEGTPALNEMLEAKDISSSASAQRYLDFQRRIEQHLKDAEDLFNAGKYSETLELVDKVLDLDPSSETARVLFEKTIKAREEARIKKEHEMRTKVAQNEQISKYMAEAQRFLNDKNYEEALRVAKKALAVNPLHEGALELTDTIELKQFEASLKQEGFTSEEILERMIYEHLKLYKQYTDESLPDLAKKELQKVSVLETYKEKIGTLQE